MFKSPNLLSDILLGLKSVPHKSLLSIGIISIGMLLLIILVAVLDSLEQQANEKIRALGVNVFVISNSPDKQISSLRLNDKTFDMLRLNFPDHQMAPVKKYQVRALGDDATIDMIGTSSDLLMIRGWNLVQGRFLMPSDILAKTRVAVINTWLQTQWGWSVGSIVPIGRTTFRIIGIVDLPDNIAAIPGESETSAIRAMFVPYSLAPYWETSQNYRRSSLDAIFVKSSGIDQFQSLIAKTKNLLFTPGQGIEPFRWLTPAHLIAEITELKHTLTFTLGGVSALSLVMGSITLITLMLSNVRERKVEIGLRRALGATPSDIQVQFVAEALLITSAAAVVGYCLAFIFIKLGITVLTKGVILHPGVLWAPLLVSLVIGSIASYWPARLAASISPAIALRSA